MRGPKQARRWLERVKWKEGSTPVHTRPHNHRPDTDNAGVVGLIVELVEPAFALWVAEKVLGCEDNQGLAELAVDLRCGRYRSGG